MGFTIYMKGRPNGMVSKLVGTRIKFSPHRNGMSKHLIILSIDKINVIWKRICNAGLPGTTASLARPGADPVRVGGWWCWGAGGKEVWGREGRDHKKAPSPHKRHEYPTHTHTTHTQHPQHINTFILELWLFK